MITGNQTAAFRTIFTLSFLIGLMPAELHALETAIPVAPITYTNAHERSNEPESRSPVPRNAYDLRFMHGSGYYVSPENLFTAATPTGKPVVISGVNLEVIAFLEFERRCGGVGVADVRYPCSNSQVLAKIWPTSVNERAVPFCVCVEKNKLATDDRGLPAASEVPAFPSISSGTMLALYPTHPGLQVFRPDGSLVNPENFSNLLVQDLGPGGRDEFGRPHRYVRFYKKTASGVLPIASSVDNIYLVLDGGPTADSQNALTHIQVGNVFRQNGSTRELVGADRVDGSMYMQPLLGSPHLAMIFKMKDGAYQPINNQVYGLYANPRVSIDGFVDMRRDAASVHALEQTLVSRQLMPRLAHSLSELDAELPMPAGAADDEHDAAEHETQEHVVISDATQPVAQPFQAAGTNLFRPNGTRAKEYQNMSLEIVQREPVTHDDGSTSYLVRLWRPNEFGSLEPFNHRSIYGVSLSPEQVTGFLPHTNVALGDSPQVFREIRKSRPGTVHVPKDTPPSERQQAMIDNALARRQSYNLCSWGVKQAMVRKNAYDLPMRRCDAFEVDLTYDFIGNGWSVLDTVNPDEAPPGAIIIYDSFAKRGTYKSLPKGRSADDMRVDFPDGVDRRGYLPYYGHIEIKTNDRKYPFVSDHKQKSSIIDHPQKKNMDEGWGFRSSLKREYKVVGIYYKK